MSQITFRYKGSSKSGNHGHAGRQGRVGGSAPKSFAYPIGGIGTPVDIDNYRIAGKTGAEWRSDQQAITAAGHDALLADVSLNYPNVTDQQAQDYVERLDAHRGMVFEEALLTAQGYNLTAAEQKTLVENVINHDVDKYLGEQSAPYMTRHDDRKMWWEAMGKHHDNNPHHPEYWQINDKRAEQMPVTDFIEMIGDWKGTARYFKTEKDAYYRQNGGSMVLHPETRAAAERELGIKHTPFPKNYPEGHFKTYERKLDKDQEALQSYLQRLKPGAAPALKAEMEHMVSWIDKIKKTEGDGYGAPFLAGIDHVFSTINKFDKPRHKELIISAKGSSKSGNYGHAGRKGKVGGSAPKSKGNWTAEDDAWLADVHESKYSYNPKSTTEDVKKFLEENFPGMKAADLRAAYEMTDSETGLSSRIHRIAMNSDHTRLIIKGPIEAAKGESGVFTREFHKNGVVDHTYFEMSSSQQAKGFGSKFYKNSEDVYMRTGVKRVDLIANLEVGGYAWARMGFDFVNDYEKIKFTVRLDIEWKRNYPGVPMPKLEHAWDIAALTGPDGARIGKKALLGEGWEATKILDPTATGVVVGRAYYAAKGVK